MARKKSNKRKEFHQKIRRKKAEIRNSRNGDRVDFSEREIERVMNEYGVNNYRIEMWGDVIVKSKFDNWKISVDPDEEVVTLHHENKKLARKGNYRSRYHIHNVFYDIEYCVKSIVEHDAYIEYKIKNIRFENGSNRTQDDNSS